MAMLAILAACHKYFACGNKVLFCSVLFPSPDDERGSGLSCPMSDVPLVITAVPWLTAEVSVRNAVPWVAIGVRKISQSTAVSVCQVGWQIDNLWAAKLSYSIEYGYIFRDFALNVPAGLAFLRMAIGERTISVTGHILARVPLERLVESTFLGPCELFSSYITNSYEH